MVEPQPTAPRFKPRDKTADGEWRAHRDAMRAIAANIPNPKTFARLLPLDLAKILLGAMRDSYGYRVYEADADRLFPHGLAEGGRGHRYLTAFGMKVLKALREQDA